MRTLVVGAGAAGTAAALTAAAEGARVTLVDAGPGATTLSTGALDELPWQSPAASRSPSPGRIRAVLDALGAHAFPDAGVSLATAAGIVRPAPGRDLALLDLRPLEGKRIGVVGCDRPGWDARALAHAWGDGFVALDAKVIRHVDERVLPDTDLAARHDDVTRLGWLAERLRAALGLAAGPPDALVLPPWLGVRYARASALSGLVGLPCGEAVSAPGGPSGLRFEQARERALVAAAVERLQARVTRVWRRPGGWSAAFGDDALDADSVVLALGGLIGGGIEYAPSEAIFSTALPPYARTPFRLAIDAPVTIGARGRPLGLPGSLFGLAPETIAWPLACDALIDRVGALAGADGRVAPGLFVAGELRADRPRTWLDALATGVAAGAAAAHETAT